MQYRIQCKDEATGKFRTLAMMDYSVSTDAEALAVIARFKAETRCEYRAQFKHGSKWYPVIAKSGTKTA